MAAKWHTKVGDSTLNFNPSLQNVGLGKASEAPFLHEVREI